MFLESIKIVETSPCIAEEGMFKAITRAPVCFDELLPYLNAVVEKPNYQPNANSLMFKRGKVGFTIKGSEINITKFVNNTELHEILDWIKDLISDIYDSKDDIEPNFKEKKIVPALTIYNLLPKTNCRKCGESSCMAFATKLNKLDVELDECVEIDDAKYAEQKTKLLKLMK